MEPRRVRFENRGALVVAKRKNRAGAVPPDAGQRKDVVVTAGDAPVETPRHNDRRLAERAGAAIISESFPERQNLFFRRGRERARVGEPREKTLEIARDSLRRRLLEHDLADPDAVGRRIVAPWETASMRLEPR